MNAIFFVGAQLVVIAIGVIVLARALKHRLPGRWAWWCAGALAFVASQVLRIPLLAAMSIGAAGATTVILVVQLLTSGLFEETARYVVLRWLAKDARSWPAAVMFGAGHGGIEAVILFGLGLVNVTVLMLGGDALVAQAQAAAPQQAEALRAQIQALRNAPAWTYGLGVFERALAIALHIAFSVMVMRAVRGDGAKWLLIAIASHVAINTVAVLTAQYAGTVAAESVLTVVAIGCLAFVRRQRQRDGGGLPSA
jgi:uncharacterized membrane protein YhfC